MRTLLKVSCVLAGLLVGCENAPVQPPESVTSPVVVLGVSNNNSNISLEVSTLNAPRFAPVQGQWSIGSDICGTCSWNGTCRICGVCNNYGKCSVADSQQFPRNRYPGAKCDVCGE